MEMHPVSTKFLDAIYGRIGEFEKFLVTSILAGKDDRTDARRTMVFDRIAVPAVSGRSQMIGLAQQRKNFLGDNRRL